MAKFVEVGNALEGRSPGIPPLSDNWETTLTVRVIKIVGNSAHCLVLSNNFLGSTMLVGHTIERPISQLFLKHWRNIKYCSVCNSRRKRIRF